MKKNILIFASLATTCIHGMETVSSYQATINSWSIFYYGTKIHLTQESLFDISDKVDITVVGRYQQKMLGDNEDFYDSIVGMIYFPDPAIIYQKKDNNSTSDDIYKPYHPKKKELPSNSKIIESQLIKVVEPCIIQKCHTKKIGEKIIRTITKRKTISKNVTLKNNIPIVSEAEYALARCYHNALFCPKFMMIMNDNIKKRNITFPIQSIALATLSVDLGFPRQKAAHIAVRAIIEFINNNPNMYSNIYFIIEKRSDFDMYKKLLLKPWEKIVLFLCASQDKGSILSMLPPEIIKHILIVESSFNS